MAKTITSITLTFCLLTISLTVEAQQRVTGQVTEELDGTPMPFATVFISGTTIGTQTDIDGNFSLTVPIQGSFEVVVSHIGFRSESRRIDTPQTTVFDEVLVNMNSVVYIEIQEHFGLPMSITGGRYDAVVRITTSHVGRNFRTISPLGYQIRQEFFSPAYTTPEQRAMDRPDLRTTVFWNPSVTTRGNAKVEIYFYTSDNVGNYVVVIEGITDEGGIVHSVSRIR